MPQSEWGRGVWDGLFVVGVVLLVTAVGVSGRSGWVRPSFSLVIPRERPPAVVLPYRGVTPRLVNNGFHGSGAWPGRDWATPCGTPLYAPITGVVRGKGFDGYVGPYGSNNSFLYLVNDEVEVMLLHGRYVVAVGDTVMQGVTLIGYEGTLGNSTGCHTHFSIRVHGEVVDPRRQHGDNVNTEQ